MDPATLALSTLDKPGIRQQIEVEFGTICARLEGEDPPDKIVLRGKQYRFPSWLKSRKGGGDRLFAIAHYTALAVLVYASAWSFAAVQSKEVPSSILWQPARLTKLGYPMVPVILGCWIRRHRFKAHRMTAGYYFANLKMALMPSLGPGMLIGVLLRFLFMKLGGLEEKVGLIYAEFMLPLAWLFGCLSWILFVWVAQRRGKEILSPVTYHKDWGYYKRWVLKPDAKKKWQEWLVKGPHWLPSDVIPIIPAADRGTFHGITAADLTRTLGITFFCVIWWFVILLWGLYAQTWMQEFNNSTERLHPWIKMLILTEMPNLITNTLTTPILIKRTWRDEPMTAGLVRWQDTATTRHAQGDKNQPLLYAADNTFVTVENDDRGQPYLFRKVDIDQERQDLLSDLMDAIRKAGQRL